MHKKSSAQDLARAAMVAAVYTILTTFLPIPQYQGVQFRIAECMTLLPFLFPWATPGLIVGCLLSNLLGSPFVLDWVFGTAATALACFLTSRASNKYVALLPPVLCNAIIVGWEITFSTLGSAGGNFLPLYAFNALTVGLGELAVCCLLGLPLLTFLSKIEAVRGNHSSTRTPTA